MRKLIFLLLITLSFNSVAQDLSNFKTLKAGGTIPEDFIKLTSEKYKEDLAANTDETLGKDFFLSTRFFIDELLLSGKMLFNEPLSDYLNKVAKYTLRRQKKLFDELRFYVLKSTIVNAFSTDQGIIIFTTGLLAQLENEAQLAYIIAHEVSHYTEHHVRESYVEKQSLRRGKGKYQRLGYESKISQLSIYEKDNELEADQKGIEIYLDSEYAIDEIFSSFEMLLYSYLPFEEVKFDSTFFNTDILIVPGDFFPDTTNEITVEEDFDDENSSHPNVEKRMDAAFDFVDGKSSRGDLKFKISEEEFYKIRDLARFESLNLLIADRQYAKALYTTFLLKRKFTDNRFLDLSMVKALYGLSKYKNATRYREVSPKLKKIEGESYLLHFFLKQLSRGQLSVIAYRHAHDFALKYDNDPIFKLYEEDMKKELAINSRIKANDLKEKPYQNFVDDIQKELKTFNVEDSIRAIEDSDLSKYEKIRLKKKLRTTEEGTTVEESDRVEKFHLFALYDLVKDKDLIKDLKELKKEEEQEEDRVIAENLDNYKIGKKEKTPDIHKVMVVDPVFENYGINRKRKHTKSEDSKIDMADAYTKNYPKLDIETELIDSKHLVKEGVHKYNEMGLVFQWLGEVVEHDELEMISSTHDQMVDVKNKYGTDHFLFTGVYAYKDRHEMTSLHWYGILFFYTIPLVVVDLLMVHNNFELVAFSVNAEDDSIEFISTDQVNLKANNRVVEAYIYDILYQLQLSKQEKK